MTDPRRDAWGDFIAGGLMVVGALLAALCGSCTLYFGGGSLWAMLVNHASGWNLGLLLLALVIGGLPTLGGLVLFREGLKHFRRRKPPGGSQA